MQISALKATILSSVLGGWISLAGATPLEWYEAECLNGLPRMILQSSLKTVPSLRKQVLNLIAEVLKMDRATLRHGNGTRLTPESLLHEWENGHFHGETGYLPGLWTSMEGIRFKSLDKQQMANVINTMMYIGTQLSLAARGAKQRVPLTEILNHLRIYVILHKIYSEIAQPIPRVLQLFRANYISMQGKLPPTPMMEQITEAANETSRSPLRQSLQWLRVWEDEKLHHAGRLPGLSPNEQGRRYLELPDVLRAHVKNTFAFTPTAEVFRFMEAHPEAVSLPEDIVHLFRIQILLEIFYKKFYRSPDALEQGPWAIRDQFHRFLRRHKAAHSRVSPRVRLSDFMPDVTPEHSQFVSPDDTIFYSSVLSRALSIIPPDQVDQLIDLGAGSSIPTLIAIQKNAQEFRAEKKHHALKITAIDIDSEALQVSQRNVQLFNLGDRYTFVQGDLLEFLRTHTITPRSIVAANPPYLPMPAGITDPRFAPVNGGPEGTRYISEILEHPFPSGTHVVLIWSSLSNPSKIIPLIERHFEVLSVEAREIPFGAYTSSTTLLPHIQAQTELGAAIHAITSTNSSRSYTGVGIILRKK